MGQTFHRCPSVIRQKPLMVKQNPELLNHVKRSGYFKPRGQYGVLRVGDSRVQILTQQD